MMSTQPSRVLTMPRSFAEIDGGSTRASYLNAALFTGFCLTIFSAPLAMGAVFIWSVFALEIAATCLFLLWVARELLSERAQVLWNPMFAPAILFAAVIALQLAFHISAVGFLTRQEALKYVAYGLLLFVAAQAITGEGDYRRFAAVAIVFGLAVALFAIVQSLTSNGRVYWLFRPENPSYIFGPYVNRNHFAGLMELLAPLPLVLAVTLKPLKGGKRMMLVFAAIIMGGSVVLSLSRGGMLALVAEISLLFGYVAWRRATRAALMLLSACLLMAAFLWWVGSEQLILRFRTEGASGMSAQARLDITRSAITMARQRPLLGWGLGTFATVYPPFRNFYGDRYVNEAHNDYAQVLVETGIIGLATLLWVALLLAKAAWRRARYAESDLRAAIRLGLLLGCAGLLAHSFVDFNLQIPANAALFYVCCGLAAAGSRNPRNGAPAAGFESAGWLR
jgi:O-antigen ligase